MANNFKSVEVSLSNASETDIVAATSNNQIIIGLNACNKGTTTLTLNVTMRDGSNNFLIAKGVSIPPSSKVEILRGKYVLATGYSLKAQSSASGGDVDMIVGLLVDVS